MKRLAPTAALLPLILLGACASMKTEKPPVAATFPHKLEANGHSRVDDYFWLNKRGDPAVTAYLEAENKYAEAALSHTKGLQKRLFSEMKSRIKEDDSTAPFRDGGYYYYARYEKGNEYPLYCRKKGSLSAPEEIILNVPEMAKGSSFYGHKWPQVSDDGKIMAHAADLAGRRIYTIRFRDLSTGRDLPDTIKDTTPNMAWANDGKTLFYVKQDTQTLRWDRVYRHTLGQEKDELVYTENDGLFEVSVGKTLSRKYMVLHSGATLTSEARILEADNPGGAFRVFAARRRGVEYSVTHAGNDWLVLTNDNAKNFKVMKADEDKTESGFWKEYLPHSDSALITGVTAFRNFLALEEMKGGLTQIRIIARGTGAEHYLDFGEPAYEASLGRNEEYETGTVRYDYSSLTTPDSTYDYDMASREKTLVKRREVPGTFRPEDYETRRVLAPAPDGALVPVSLVFRKDKVRKGENPLYVEGYGSYGMTMPPYFSTQRLSLLDRGFVYAIPHIRGGSELGRQWYEDGRQLRKKNTFTDFIAATEFLLREGYGKPGHVYAQGGSAGGLLMGAIANMRPDLYNGIIAHVPFVDVVTTMQDTSIPLTTGEFDEWGNPAEKKFYDYMLSYSPYDNIERKAYPNMFITGGLNDSQVQYWEPAKWAAKLRAMKTDKNMLILKTDMSSGHGGKSGRFERLKLAASEYAFLLDLEGLKK